MFEVNAFAEAIELPQHSVRVQLSPSLALCFNAHWAISLSLLTAQTKHYRSNLLAVRKTKVHSSNATFFYALPLALRRQL